MIKRVEKLSAEEIKAELESKANELKHQVELMAPIEAKMARIHSRMKKLEDQQVKLLIEAGEDGWPWLLSHSHRDDNQLKNDRRSQKVYNLGLCSSGFYPETEQAQIAVYHYSGTRAEWVDKTVAGLEVILPHIKVMDHGMKQVGILGLTEVLGTTYCRISELESKYEIWHDRYYSKSDTMQKSYGTMLELIEAIYDKLHSEEDY